MILDDAEMHRRVLYRDDDVIVLNKPSGIAVHKGTRTPDDLEAHFEALCFGLPHLPRLGHRLDKDTSGCLALGRHAEALARLGRLFAGRHVEKCYWAITEGHPAETQGRIDLPLLKLAGPDGARMEVHPQGQAAVTEFRVIAVSNGLAWLELRPQTGRTHQLRAHCRALGTPILGDATYGRAGETPLHLHARSLRMSLHRSSAEIAVQAPLPDHMARTFEAAGFVTS
jgi:tRNA pseudouridine32 synthase/23S rRNA pseudouridine746 synthase